MIGIWVLIDLIATMSIAVATSWFFTSRYLARRTSDHLGKNDVKLLREMYSTLVSVEALDDLVALGISDKLRERIKSAITAYAKSKELPS